MVLDIRRLGLKAPNPYSPIRNWRANCAQEKPKNNGASPA